LRSGVKRIGNPLPDSGCAVVITGLGIAAALTGGILGVILAGAFWEHGRRIDRGSGWRNSRCDNGGSFLEGFADGALSGAISGA